MYLGLILNRSVTFLSVSLVRITSKSPRVGLFNIIPSLRLICRRWHFQKWWIASIEMADNSFQILLALYHQYYHDFSVKATSKCLATGKQFMVIFWSKRILNHQYNLWKTPLVWALLLIVKKWGRSPLFYKTKFNWLIKIQLFVAVSFRATLNFLLIKMALNLPLQFFK